MTKAASRRQQAESRSGTADVSRFQRRPPGATAETSPASSRESPDRNQRRRYGIRGFVKAYDAENRKLLWNIPYHSDRGYEGVWATKDLTGREMTV